MRLALAILLALGAASSSTHLVTRATPRLSLADGACSSVLLIAEIVGPETEEWYCPKVTWEIPDGTRSSEESDCPPFDQREEFRRLWRRRICAPPTPVGTDAWEVGVELSKSGRTVAHGVVQFTVH